MSHRLFYFIDAAKLSRMHGFVVIYTWVQILAVPLNNSRALDKSVMIWASVSSPVKLWSDIPNEIIVRIKWCHVCKASDAESGTQRGHQDGSSPPLPSYNTVHWFSNFSLHENHLDSFIKMWTAGLQPSSFWLRSGKAWLYKCLTNSKEILVLVVWKLYFSETLI